MSFIHGSRAVTTQPFFPRLPAALVVVLIAALALCVSGEVPRNSYVRIRYSKTELCEFRERNPRVYRPPDHDRWPPGRAHDDVVGANEEPFRSHGPFSGDYTEQRPRRPPHVFEISPDNGQTIYRRCCWQFIDHEMDLRTSAVFCERADPLVQDKASNRDETPLKTANHELPSVPHDQVPEPKKRSKVSRLLDRLPGRRAAEVRADHDVPPPTDDLNPTKQESEISNSPPIHNWKNGHFAGHRLNGDFSFLKTAQKCEFRSNNPRVYNPNPVTGFSEGGGEPGDDAIPASRYPDWAEYGPFSPTFAQNQASAERRPGPQVWEITDRAQEQTVRRCCWQHITLRDFTRQILFCDRQDFEQLEPAVNAASIPDVNAPPQPTAHPAAKQQKNVFGASLLRDLKKK